jgi:hypothetical protein
VSPIVLDFSGLATVLVTAIMNGLREVLSPVPHDFEEWLLRAVQQMLAAQGGWNLLTHVPLEWTSENPQVGSLFRQLIAPELGIGAVVLIIGGYRVAMGKEELWYVVFRYGFLVVMGQGMFFFSDLILRCVNGIADVISQARLDIRQESLPNDLVVGLTLIVAIFCAGLAWIKGAVGALWIAALIAIAPILLPLSALPTLDGLSQWWAKEFTKWGLRPIFVALLLRIGLGLSLDNADGLQFLMAAIAFWAAYKADTVLGSFSAGVWGQASNLGLARRAANAVAGVASGGSATAVATAPGGAPAVAQPSATHP